MLTITTEQAAANIASQLTAQFNQALTTLSRINNTLANGTEAQPAAGVPAVTPAQILTALGANATPITATLTAAGFTLTPTPPESKPAMAKPPFA